MKNLIYLLLTCLLLNTNGLAFAQEDKIESENKGLLQQADILRCYSKMKRDMEERARNIKGMKNLSVNELDSFQAEYNGLRKAFNYFLADFSQEVIVAKGAPIDFCKLNKHQYTAFMKLYHQYENGFLNHYEQLTGTSPAPLLEATITQNVSNCLPKRGVINPDLYQTEYQPALVVANWKNL